MAGPAVTLTLDVFAAKFIAGLNASEAAIKQLADKTGAHLKNAEQAFKAFSAEQEKAAKASADAVKFMGDSLAGIAQKAAIATAAMGAAMFAAANRAQAVADSLRVLQNAAKQGGLGLDEARKVADTARNSFGLTQDSANRLTASVISMAQQSGNVQKTGAIMRGLGDAAAAAGVSFDQLDEIVRQTLTGQDEGLNKLRLANPSGIYKEWAAEQNKLNPALKLTATNLSDQQKMMAITEAIMKKGAENAGQAAKAMEGYAGSVNQAKQAGDDIAVALGEAFIPALSELLKLLASILRPIADWIKNNKTLAADIGITAVALTGFTAAAATSALGVIKLVETASAASKAFTALSLAVSGFQGKFPGGVLALKLVLLAAVATAGFAAGREIRDRAGMNDEEGDSFSAAMEAGPIAAAKERAARARSERDIKEVSEKNAATNAVAANEAKIKSYQQLMKVTSQNLDLLVQQNDAYTKAMPGFVKQMDDWIKKLKEAGATEEQIRAATKERWDMANKVRDLHEDKIKKEIELQKEVLKNELDLKLRAVESSDHEAADKLKITKDFVAAHLGEIQKIDRTEAALKGGQAKLEKSYRLQLSQIQADALKEQHEREKKELQEGFEDYKKGMDARLDVDKASNFVRAAVLSGWIELNAEELKKIPEYEKKLRAEAKDLDRKAGLERVAMKKFMDDQEKALEIEKNKILDGIGEESAKEAKARMERQQAAREAFNADHVQNTWDAIKKAAEIQEGDFARQLRQQQETHDALQLQLDAAVLEGLITWEDYEAKTAAISEDNARRKGEIWRSEFKKLGDQAFGALKNLTAIFGDAFGSIVDSAHGAFDAITTIVSNPTPLGMIGAVTSLVGIVGKLFGGMFEGAKGKVDEATAYMSNRLAQTRDVIASLTEELGRLTRTPIEQQIFEAAQSRQQAIARGGPEAAPLAEQVYQAKIGKIREQYAGIKDEDKGTALQMGSNLEDVIATLAGQGAQAGEAGARRQKMDEADRTFQQGKGKEIKTVQDAWALIQAAHTSVSGRDLPGYGANDGAVKAAIRQLVPGLSNNDSEITGRLNEITSAILRNQGLPTFDQGGVVPGPIGKRVVVSALGGEVFLSPQRYLFGGGGAGLGGGGMTINFIQPYLDSTDRIRETVASIDSGVAKKLKLQVRHNVR